MALRKNWNDNSGSAASVYYVIRLKTITSLLKYAFWDYDCSYKWFMVVSNYNVNSILNLLIVVDTEKQSSNPLNIR